MKGTHGTCHTRSEMIKEEGFRRSDIGKRGAGAYFWGYTRGSVESYARHLAFTWWQFAKKKGDYSNNGDDGCCIIYASFNAEPACVLDLENQLIRDKLFEYSQNVFERIAGSEDDKISAIYDMFIADVEINVVQQFKIVHVKVPQPRGVTKVLPLDITGQPSCYVVRDLSCITVERFEEIYNE